VGWVVRRLEFVPRRRVSYPPCGCRSAALDLSSSFDLAYAQVEGCARNDRLPAASADRETSGNEDGVALPHGLVCLAVAVDARLFVAQSCRSSKLGR
jgi:hypothetical protein